MTIPQSQHDRLQWTEVKNESGEEIPAFGVMRITGSSLEDNERFVLTVDKPDSETIAAQCLINGPNPIADGKIGDAANPNHPFPVAYDDGETPAAKDIWGPKDDSWELVKGGTGFMILADPEHDRVLAWRMCGAAKFKGKTTTAHDKGQTEDVEIYSGPKGSETGTGVMVPTYNSFADLDDDKFVIVDWVDSGFELISAEC